ncbi:hypothetical protein ACCO45_005959 [Purpureocillium lilacinum]|uniref:Uncharacterized protein n=1 Tax=Purpureocillium lilacinum TaxID=33203 RepID=A0ACC4DY53_PURLI
MEQEIPWRHRERACACRSLDLHLSSLADLGRETSLDGRDTSSRSAVVASDEVETVLTLAELASWEPRRWDRGRTDVFPDHVLNLFLLESALDDQSPAAVNGAVGAQLGKQVGGQVLLGTLHALADVGNVGKDGFPVAFAHALGRRDLVALGAAEGVVGVLLGQLAEEAVEQEGVANGLGLVVGPDAGAGVHVARLLLDLGGLVGVLDLELLELGGEVVVGGGVLLDLLLLLLEGQVEAAVLGGGASSSSAGASPSSGFLDFFFFFFMRDRSRPASSAGGASSAAPA